MRKRGSSEYNCELRGAMTATGQQHRAIESRPTKRSGKINEVAEINPKQGKQYQSGRLGMQRATKQIDRDER